MGSKKKAVEGGATFGKLPDTPRTRVAITDGTGGKDKYLAKYTVYNLDPVTVQTRIRDLLQEMQTEWEARKRA